MPTQAIYQVPPVVPKGYPLPPYFSVIVPVARTNLVTNPSFELATTGWSTFDGSAISRVTTQQYYGLYSLSVTGSNATAGASYDLALAASTTYAVSCKLKGNPGQTYQIAVYTTGNALLARTSIVATGRWQWVWVYYTEPTGATRRIVIGKQFGSNATAFYIDGVQVEAIAAGETVSTYIDGDQVGLIPAQYPPAYVWGGTPHGSTSSRSGQTRAGGMVVRLDKYGFLILAVIGLGMITPNNVGFAYTQLDGAQFERTQKPTRQFTVGGRFDASNTQQLARNLGAFERVIDRDAVGQQQPLVMVYQPLDACNNEIGVPGKLICSYAGGLPGSTDNFNNDTVGITFQQWLPLISGDSEIAVSLSAASSVTNANYIVERTASGTWQAMGTGLTGGLARCVQPMPDGSIVVGGDFTSAGGVANTNGIARYTPSTNTWSAIGTGVSGGVVYNLAINPDGSDLYAVGTFTSASGVANTKFIARFTGGSWTALSTGVAAGSGLYAVLYFNATNIFFAGDPTSAAGVASYNPVTNAFGGLLTMTATQVRTLALSADLSTLYIGGKFTVVNGTSVLNVAAYTIGGAVNTLAGGTNDYVDSLVLGPGGVIYIGGLFTTAGGVSAARVAQYVGNAWQPLSSGMSAEVSRLAVAPNGELWASGLFSVAGGVTLLGGVGIWRAGAWTYPDFQIPGSADARAIGFQPDGTTFIGYNSSGTGTGGASTTLNNPGSARTYPTITLTGPTTGTAQLYSILNRTTGRSLFFSTLLSAGEIATLSLNPANLSFTSNYRGNIIGTLLPGSNEAEFYLQSGNNVLTFFAASSTITATVRALPLYNTIQDLAQ